VHKVVLPSLFTLAIIAKYKGHILPNYNAFANICVPAKPALSGMPALISCDKHSNCKLVVYNCAPYDITVNRNDRRIVEFKKKAKLMPLSPNIILLAISDIAAKLPSVQEIFFQRQHYKQNQSSGPCGITLANINILFRHQQIMSLDKL